MAIKYITKDLGWPSIINHSYVPQLSFSYLLCRILFFTYRWRAETLSSGPKEPLHFSSSVTPIASRGSALSQRRHAEDFQPVVD